MKIIMLLSKLLRFHIIIPVALLIIVFQFVFIFIPGYKEAVNKSTVKIAGLPDDYSLNTFEHTNNEYKYFYNNTDNGFFNITYISDSDISLFDYLNSEGVKWNRTELFSTSIGMAKAYPYGNTNGNYYVVSVSDKLFVLHSSISSYDLTQIFRTISIREN